MTVTLMVACVALLLGVEGAPLEEISHPGTAEWDSAVAVQETQGDIANFMKVYDDQRPDLLEMQELFLKTRLKNLETLDPTLPNFRELPQWGMGFGRLIDLPGHKHDTALYDRLQDIASILLRGYKEEHSYVEDGVMRGWPMFVDPRDPKTRFEAFQSGHISMAISHAARAAGRYGHHAAAADLLGPVLSTLYDSFLTNDTEKSKLDGKGRVVYVPKRASKGRKKRHLKAVGGGSPEVCMTQPEAYNHGLVAGRAAIAAVRALDAVDWGQVEFPLQELTLDETKERLNYVIVRSAKYFRKAFSEPPVTGSDPRDNYPGPDGTAWWQWNYRDLTRCPEAHGTNKHRPEDIAHTKFDIDFIVDFRDWIQEQPDNVHVRRKYRNLFGPPEIHRLLVTFLNRIIHDYNAPAHERFACDVVGVYDGDDWGNSAKQCGNPSRAPETRPRHAVGFLPLAHTVKDKLGKNSQLSCDAFRTVYEILPHALPGEKFDSFNFATVEQNHGAKLIEAKHHFYNFEKRLMDACNR